MIDFPNTASIILFTFVYGGLAATLAYGAIRYRHELATTR